jgi:hypothetical protein
MTRGGSLLLVAGAIGAPASTRTAHGCRVGPGRPGRLESKWAPTATSS